MIIRYLTSVAYLATCFTLTASDLPFGAWKMNLDKSTGMNPTVSNFERKGDVVTNSNGQMSHQVVFDGKDYPVTGTPLYDHASWRRIDPLTYEHTMKKDGKAVYTIRTVVAKDGKTRTWSNTRWLADGTKLDFQGMQERTGPQVDASNLLLGNWRQIPMMTIEDRMEEFG